MYDLDFYLNKECTDKITSICGIITKVSKDSCGNVEVYIENVNGIGSPFGIWVNIERVELTTENETEI